ncbi:hypothetical protein SB778_29900, partial [Paraburkholderia sp. SIMBA_050]
MDSGKRTGAGLQSGRRIRYHAFMALVTLEIAGIAAAGLTLALWLASFLFVASLHVTDGCIKYCLMFSGGVTNMLFLEQIA